MEGKTGVSNTLDTPSRCLRSQHTPKPEQEPPQHCPLPGGAGGSPAGLTSNLPMFCSSLTLLPERYCQARPRSEGGIPFWHRSRICGREWPSWENHGALGNKETPGARWEPGQHHGLRLIPCCFPNKEKCP